MIKLKTPDVTTCVLGIPSGHDQHEHVRTELFSRQAVDAHSNMLQ